MNDAFVMGQGLGHQLEMALARTDWTPSLVNKATEGDFLAEVRQVLEGKLEICPLESPIVKLDHQIEFDPVTFSGKGWSIWKGPIDGDGLTGEEDRDLREKKIEQFLLAEMLRKVCLKEGETSIKGEEKQVRLKADQKKVRLGLATFLFFNQNLHLLEWLYKKLGVRYLDFPGLVLRSPGGSRYVFSFCRDDVRGGWSMDLNWLGLGRNDESFSATIADQI